ncbi:MAG: MAPEG family protein [Francisellaceae bacterium]
MMSKAVWALPVITLILISIISVFIALFSRVQALREGRISIDDFGLMNFCQQKNPWLVVTSRHLEELFQTPILFYVVMVIIMNDSQLMSITYFLVLAWLFTGFRILHSLIHLTYNNTVHRLAIFLTSNTFLLAMIIMLMIELIMRQ